MSYSKPEIVTLGSSVNLVQGTCKGSQTHPDTVILNHNDATPAAYEADE
jgi:hypothetical protein